MSNTPLIGRGCLLLALEAPDLKRPQQRRVRYEIRRDGIVFFALGADAPGSSRDQPIDLFDWAAGSGDAVALTGEGHLALAVLPATPRDAFYGVQFSLQGDALTLRLQYDEPFAGLFGALHLTFVQGRTPAPPVVSGQLSVRLLDAETPLPLQATWSEDGRLVFRNGGPLPFGLPAEPPVDTPADPSIDRAHFSNLDVRGSHDRWAGIQALYTFDEGHGQTLFDSAGAGAPLDMKIREDARSTWTDGALSVSNARIRTPHPRDLRGRPNPMVDRVKRFRSTGAFSLEAWFRPSGRAQEEASIFSFSREKAHRNLALEHERSGGSDRFDVRLRTGDQDTHSLEIRRPATNEPICLVYTRDQTGLARLYIDGKPCAENRFPGSFDGWGEDFRFALANEASKREHVPWRGDLHRVALYDRALSPEEVARNYLPELAFSLDGAYTSAQRDGLVKLRADGRINVQAPREDPQEAPPVQFEGTGALHILDAPVFAGDLLLEPDGLVLDGRFDLFPVWSPFHVTGAGRVTIDLRGRLSLGATPVDAGMSDFALAHPTLEMENGQLTLRGSWLGNDLALSGRERANRFVLVARTSFSLPFGLTLRALRNPITGERLAEKIHVGRQAGVRHLLRAELVTEVSASGFLAVANGRFKWSDPAGTLHELAVPPFYLYTPPTTRNILLGHILTRLEAHAEELFADKLLHASNFYITGEAPLIYLGTPTDGPFPPVTTALPPVFADDVASVASENGLFELTQKTKTATLTLTPGDRSGHVVADEYRAFLDALEARGLRPGALLLIKQRIAERLPASFDRVLYYYYGFDPDHGAVDLHAGMRLRVDYQNYQFVHPSDDTAQTGFVGSGSACYHLGSYAQNGDGAYLLGFDAFLSTLPVTTRADAARVGAAGLIDVQQAAYRLPYFRLYYPNDFAGSSGRVGTERMATLVGARTRSALEAAGREFLDTGTVQATPERASFFFRGRAVVVPEVAVFIGGQAVYVPVGTTVRQLYERYTGMAGAGAGGLDITSFAGARRPRRLIHEGTSHTPAYRYVVFDAYRRFGNVDPYDLPVVLGDRFVL